jgi:hypothetical protein
MAAAASMGDRVNTVHPSRDGAPGNRWQSVRPLLTIFGTFMACMLVFAIPARADTYYVTVAGLGGEPDYEQRFTALANDLDRLLKASGADVHVFTLTGEQASRVHLTETMDAIAKQSKPEDSLVVILIGHGSFDGVEYKLNLRGPDISGPELAAMCNKVSAKRQLVVNTTSASGGSLVALQKPGRAVITATKTGTEKNATVFARYWVDALRDPTADVNKDDAISALEAYQFAARKTADFYESQKRLATEHPVFEDAGKNEAVREPSTATGEGQLVSSFTLLRIGAAQRAAADPAKRDLLAKKEELERKIDTLKYQKAAMAEDEYKKELTAALVELARIQEVMDK